MFTSGDKDYLSARTVGQLLVSGLVNDCRYAESSFLVFESPGSTGAILNVAGLGLRGGNYG